MSSPSSPSALNAGNAHPIASRLIRVWYTLRSLLARGQDIRGITTPRLSDAQVSRIQAAQVSALLRFTPATACIAVFNAILVVMVCWEGHAPALLLAWLGAVGALSVIAVATWKAHRDSPATPPSRLAEWLAFQALARAAVWGSLPATLFAIASPFERFVLGCLAAGMITGGAFTLSALPRAGIAYTWTLCILLAVGMAASGETALLVAAALLCLYAGVISHNVAAFGQLFVANLRAQTDLAEQKSVVSLLLRDFQESASDCLWETDADGRLQRAPVRFMRALSGRQEALLGMQFLDLLKVGHPDSDASADLAALDRLMSSKDAFRDVQVRLSVAAGEERVWTLTAKPIWNETESFVGFRGVASDVTDRVRAEAQATYLARHDALTGLPNRRGLAEHFAAACARARREGGVVGLLLLDLDRFKPVNDLFGHAAGDNLLQQVGGRLRAAVRETDVVARLGGDEFAILAHCKRQFSDPTASDVASEEDAAGLARRVLIEVSRSFVLVPGDQAVHVGGSVGVALSPDDGTDLHELMRCADLAMYRAKAEGRGKSRFYDRSMDERMRERAALEADLRQAIHQGDLVPHFQPLVELSTGRLIGFEMLARWTHPVRGAVPPADFIAVAEETGLVTPLTEHLLRAACRVAADWPDHLLLTCNVSPVQLRDRSLPILVGEALAAAGLPPHRLELELTENALVADLDFAREIMAQLKGLGVRLSLDDFGTGHSSLRHLQALPFDKLKIDAGFVRSMTTSGDSRKIVAAVVGLGHSLGLPIVAEGVEDAKQANALRNLGCDIGQGWLFGRAMPAADAVALVQSAGGHQTAPNAQSCVGIATCM